MNEKSELINPQKAYFNGKFKEKLQKAPGVQAEMEQKLTAVKTVIRGATGWPAARRWLQGRFRHRTGGGNRLCPGGGRCGAELFSE